jgi:NRAMP (natural resistance-associated macrophage protein)-like metal ion transporter
MRRSKHVRKHLHKKHRHHANIISRKYEENLNSKSSFVSKIKSVLQRFGPGIITGASDDDPSGITTYSQAGASFGLQTLWTAFLSFPLMAAIQEMCGRIGLVTNMGLTKVVKKHYPKWVIYLIGLVTVPAIVLNIAANLAGMGAVSNMLFPAIPTWVFTILSALAIMFSLILFSYKKIESILKWLALVLLTYLIVPFFITLNWNDILYSVLSPKLEFTKEYVAIIVAILGTTISPYLFFWEASMEVEEHQEKHLSEQKVNTTILEEDLLEVTPNEIKTMRQDNNLGMFLSNFVMFFIILVTGTVLFNGGAFNIDSVQEAASALKPLAGDFAYLLFAVGVIGTGFLAIPVLAGACGYIVAEMFDWKEGMNNKFKQARGFYEVICFCIMLGLGLNISGIDPIQGMIWSAMVYGITAPVLIAIIMHIGNRNDIMGKWKNGWLSNLLGGAGLVLMTIAAITLLVVGV